MGDNMPQSLALREALQTSKKNLEISKHGLEDLPSDKILLTIPEACRFLRVSKWTLYRLFDDNALWSIKVRGRRLVPTAEALRYVAQRLEIARQLQGAA